MHGRPRVVLRCGSAVYFANANLAPRAGEEMPCPRHGYCGVVDVEAASSAMRVPTRRRAPRRTIAELLAYVRATGTCTLANLRSQRFTLRLLNDAVRAGLIAIDVAAGDVFVDPSRLVTRMTFQSAKPDPAPRRVDWNSRRESAPHGRRSMSEQATTGIDRSTAVRQAADRLHDAQISRTTTNPVRDVLGRSDIAAAYEVQAMLTARRLAAGSSIVGRKIGLTSLAVQTQLGVDQPDFGVLFDDMQVPDGGVVDTSTLIQPKAEAEVAFVLGADLDGDADSITFDRVLAAVEYAVGAVEIVDSRNADWDISITDTVADNASSAMYVLGVQRVALSEFRPVDVTMTLTKNGDLVSTGNGEACLGDPVNALLWLARTVASYGSPLRAGEVVLSGALGPMVPVGPGAEIVAELSILGRVGVSFT